MGSRNQIQEGDERTVEVEEGADVAKGERNEWMKENERWKGEWEKNRIFNIPKAVGAPVELFSL